VGFFPSYYQHILVQKEAYPSHPLEGPANQKEEEEEEEKKNRTQQSCRKQLFAPYVQKKNYDNQAKW